MRCSEAREAVSAQLDGEVSPAETGELESHLASCPECRAWKEAAHQVTRRARLGPARPVPESLPGPLTGGVPRTTDHRAAPRLRLLLVAFGLAQLAVAFHALFFSSVDVDRDLAAFDTAIGVGFLVAAWRPSRAVGMRSVVGTAAVLLLASASVEVAQGDTTVLAETPHLLTAGGWLLLHRLGRVAGPRDEDRLGSGSAWRALPGWLTRSGRHGPAGNAGHTSAGRARAA